MNILFRLDELILSIPSAWVRMMGQVIRALTRHLRDAVWHTRHLDPRAYEEDVLRLTGDMSSAGEEGIHCAHAHGPYEEPWA